MIDIPKMINNKVMFELKDKEEVTGSGIIKICSDNEQCSGKIGKVVATNNIDVEHGKWYVFDYNKADGIKLEGKDYYIVDAGDVLAEAEYEE